ncbi:GNAT family N-acetyltransferase [Devosia sp.]|uniref:GNAT family N-acetyltransferase n=1 Tax=Devosia sp. TaxID=1871048 RepID=UPI003A9016B5
MRNAPTLDTARLRLRPHRGDDFPAMHAMWADPEVTRHISGIPSSENASWQRSLRYAGHWALLGYGYWLIERRNDGAFVGEAGFADFRRTFDPPQPETAREPEAGWVLRADMHGQGYAIEALTRIFEWAETETDWRSSFCIIAPEHAASLRLAGKLGFNPIANIDLQGEVTLLRRSFDRPDLSA